MTIRLYNMVYLQVYRIMVHVQLTTFQSSKPFLLFLAVPLPSRGKPSPLVFLAPGGFTAIGGFIVPPLVSLSPSAALSFYSPYH